MFPVWCKSCQQDVPAVAATESDDGVCCARCGGPVGHDGVATKYSPTADEPVRLDDTLVEPPPSLADDWDAEQQLRRAVRVLQSSTRPAKPTDAHTAQLRFDPPQLDLRPWQAGQARRSQAQPAPARRVRGAWIGGLAWLMLALGLMGLACGGVLLGWSIFENRPELWRQGMPILIAGQCTLVLGLLLQLERVWQNGRHNQSKLHEVDQRLADLNHQAAMLGTTHSTASKAFYSHLAEGASPQILLADVKGQLDMLAVQMANRSRG